MKSFLTKLYPDSPSEKTVRKIVDILRDGGLVIYPTDTVYAIGCDALNMRAVERLCQFKGLNPQKSNLSILCQTLSEVSSYAKVSNQAFKLMKRNTPGPFTFVLPAGAELPRVYKQRKEIGVRIPDNGVIQAILSELNHPLLTMSVRDAEDDVLEYITDPELIFEKFQHAVDAVIDGGTGHLYASTIVDCRTDDFDIIRQGLGELQ